MHVLQANTILCCTRWILLTPMLTDCIRYALRGARALFPVLLNVFCHKRFKTIAHKEWSDVNAHNSIGAYGSWRVYFTGFIYSILPAWSPEKKRRVTFPFPPGCEQAADIFISWLSFLIWLFSTLISHRHAQNGVSLTPRIILCN